MRNFWVSYIIWIYERIGIYTSFICGMFMMACSVICNVTASMKTFCTPILRISMKVYKKRNLKKASTRSYTRHAYVLQRAFTLSSIISIFNLPLQLKWLVMRWLFRRSSQNFVQDYLYEKICSCKMYLYFIVIVIQLTNEKFSRIFKFDS